MGARPACGGIGIITAVDMVSKLSGIAADTT
jgi:hypothetical protein